MTLRCQLRNSLGSVFRPQDHILFSSLWTVPSGLVPRVSCLVASSLSIIINFFSGSCQGLLFFYSFCLLHSSLICWNVQEIFCVMPVNDPFVCFCLWCLNRYPYSFFTFCCTSHETNRMHSLIQTNSQLLSHLGSLMSYLGISLDFTSVMTTFPQAYVWNKYTF